SSHSPLSLSSSSRPHLYLHSFPTRRSSDLPKLSKSYHFKDLAGVGVAFQFSHYLLEYFPTELLDFVAIGTVADLVPLRGENRILTYFGIDALTNTLNIGLEALKASAGITEN